MNIKIHSKAPTRIDLSGGTLDLWPLYLLVDQAKTINIGIDLYASCDLEIFSDQSGEEGITLHSVDQNEKIHQRWEDFKTYQAPPSLELHTKLVKHFLSHRSVFPKALKLSTRAKSPAGAGLGGSSALAVAIIGALQTWKLGRSFDPRNESSDAHYLLDLVRDVETTVIKVPAGVQDYYGAMFGGLQCLNWHPGKMERKDFSTDLIADLQQRLLLFYSGKSRNSGINNWELFKALIDQNPKVQKLFQSIANATLDLENALLLKDWNKVGDAISQEWGARKQLAKGISTPEIDEAFSEFSKFSKPHMKICGAGGGGCFFIYLSEKNLDSLKTQSQKIVETAQKLKITPLPIQLATTGLETELTRA